MVGTRHVVPDRFRGVFAEENGTGIINKGQVFFRVRQLYFQMLRRNLIDDIKALFCILQRKALAYWSTEVFMIS